MISTKGRYALRAMIDLAEHADDGFVTLKDIAARQGLSESYLENIAAQLSKAKIVVSKRGMSGGGFKLAASPEQLTVADILLAAGETLVPVVCMREGEESCKRNETRKTMRLWQRYYEVTMNFLTGVTLADVCSDDENAIPHFVRVDPPQETAANAGTEN